MSDISFKRKIIYHSKLLVNHGTSLCQNKILTKCSQNSKLIICSVKTFLRRCQNFDGSIYKSGKKFSLQPVEKQKWQNIYKPSHLRKGTHVILMEAKSTSTWSSNPKFVNKCFFFFLPFSLQNAPIEVSRISLGFAGRLKVFSNVFFYQLKANPFFFTTFMLINISFEFKKIKITLLNVYYSDKNKFKFSDFLWLISRAYRHLFLTLDI